MNYPSNMALNFPCKVIKKNQLRSGVWQVQIEILPEDMPTEFLTAAPESEWMIATVRQDENGAPQAPSQPEDKKARKSIWTMQPPNQAALLCDMRDFQNFLNEGVSVVTDKETAKTTLYRLFNITTRRDLVKPMILPEWQQLIREYRTWLDEARYGDNLNR